MTPPAKPRRKPGPSTPRRPVRTTVQILLRLPPEDAQTLRDLASRDGGTISGWVVEAVRRAEL